MANWCDLLPEIVSKIAGEIYYYEDLVNFLGVCSSWEHAVAEDESFVEPVVSRLPCLMLAESKTEEEQEEYRQLFLLSNGGVLRKIYLPEARNQRILSSRGWLLTVAVDDDEVKLVHPFSRVRIYDLPTLKTYSFLVNRVLLTSSIPSDPCFRVIVILGSSGSLAFCKLGDESWTLNLIEFSVYDLTYHHGRRKAYVVDVKGILEYDILGSDPINNLSLLSEFPHELWSFSHFFDYTYVMEWDVDNLLIVIRLEGESDYQVEEEYHRTVFFEAFLFDLNNHNWTKVESLGNKAVFVGYNSTFAIDAVANTTIHGDVKPDCIYYTDNCFGHYDVLSKDMGIYHMADGNITTHYKEQSLCRDCPPLWLSPL